MHRWHAGLSRKGPWTRTISSKKAMAIHWLPVAVFDTQALQGGVTVHFADGSERYTTLGESEEDHPEPGEVVFSDKTKLVIARRWCWRQSEQSAAQADTTRALITVEGHHAQAQADVEAAQHDLLDLLQTYAGGATVSALLDARHREFSI